MPANRSLTNYLAARNGEYKAKIHGSEKLRKMPPQILCLRSADPYSQALHISENRVGQPANRKLEAAREQRKNRGLRVA
jgi:hypothetical protein